MKHIGLKLLLIGLLVGFCLFEVIPPKEKIRLGKDLRGGVSLVYAINIPEESSSDQVITQVIEVLKRRVNPKGVLDITFQPVGGNRMAVVMPPPGPELCRCRLLRHG